METMESRQAQGVTFWNVIGLLIFLMIGAAAGVTTWEKTGSIGSAMGAGIGAFIVAVIFSNMLFFTWPIMILPKEIDEEE